MQIAGLFLIAAIVSSAPSSAAQKPKSDVCPWCKNDGETMKRAGVVTHGPMPIGPWTSVELPGKVPASQWVTLETAHMRFASSLPAIDVELADQGRVRAELDQLRAVLPSVPMKPRTLDPWLRLHLIAMKSEAFYVRFQTLLDVKDADFPESRTAKGPYMGDGRFLGEKDKFEVVLHSARAGHNLFTKEFAGASVSGALRWHFPNVHKMLVSIPCEDEFKKDRWLFPHIVHNLSHLFFSAYKHFSYEPPTWIDEGLALAMEKEIEPRSTTNEGEEGTFNDRRHPADWSAEVRKMIAGGDHEKMSELMRIREVGELEPRALYTSWSMTRYLIEKRPSDLAKFLGGLKGQLDAQGLQSGADMPGLQRKLLKEIFELTPQGFDDVWVEWASAPPVPAGK
ncbi:MAG: hypothetical protein SGI72_10240 [Planctomycetota bacterium]|nr:hypothetical protein [Planctomycetota bacterium]